MAANHHKRLLELSINGEVYELAVACQETLLEVLRSRLGLTGTKEGCGTGECGSCTVLLEGEPVLACLLLAVDCENKKIETIKIYKKDYAAVAKGNDHKEDLKALFAEHEEWEQNKRKPKKRKSAKKKK